MSPLRKPFSYTYINAALIIVALNVAVYLLMGMSGLPTGYVGLSVIGMLRGHFWWQPLTYMFVHGGFSHIFFNMFGLLVFGIPVERKLGSKEFLLLYLLCGVLDGLVSLAVYWLSGMYYVVLIGASGALYSILLVFAVIYPRSIISVFGIIPVPAPLFVLAYTLIELGNQFFGSSNVAHLTHLAGFVLAWLYLVIRLDLHPIKIWKDAWRR